MTTSDSLLFNNPNVKIHALESKWEGDFDSEFSRPEKTFYQRFHALEKFTIFTDDDESNVKLIAYIGVGIRWVNTTKDSANESDGETIAHEVIASLEATYSIAFDAIKIPSLEEVQTYLKEKALDLIWPYWRETHLIQSKQMNFPKFEISIIPDRQLFIGEVETAN